MNVAVENIRVFGNITETPPFERRVLLEDNEIFPKLAIKLGCHFAVVASPTSYANIRNKISEVTSSYCKTTCECENRRKILKSVSILTLQKSVATN